MSDSRMQSYNTVEFFVYENYVGNGRTHAKFGFIFRIPQW